MAWLKCSIGNTNAGGQVATAGSNAGGTYRTTIGSTSVSRTLTISEAGKYIVAVSAMASTLGGYNGYGYANINFFGAGITASASSGSFTTLNNTGATSQGIHNTNLYLLETAGSTTITASTSVNSPYNGYYPGCSITINACKIG